ncbi:hypothetical protein EI94DRAFT_1700980 [Lactarius quietus]|nr:hypothetical protein EI94DRAFT_1700980 [Lactarius quietus]
MFPFIFAFILAIGIPFLPSSLHRALHLPSLRINFLSSSYAPERSFIPSSERPPLLENGYSRETSNSGDSSQYLVFPSPNYSGDSDVLAYMSFTEKLLELNYPQTSIWLVICAQLLYQLVEAMVIMTLSFLFAATFLSRRSLSTLMERSCTALIICRVLSDQAPTTPANTSQPAPLEVLADSVLSPATISEGLDLIASNEANRWSENTSSIALITPPRSRETSSSLEPTLMSLGQPAYPPSTGKQGTQVKPIPLPICGPSKNVGSPPLGSAIELSQYERSSDVLGTPVAHHLFRSTSSSIIKTATNQNSDDAGDLYSAKKSGSTSFSHSPPPGEGRENNPPDAKSLDHGSIASINSSPPNLEPDENQAEGLRPSESERPGGHRRYKSDGIQVRSARCHLGDPAAPPDPSKVDGTCIFWKNAVRHDENVGGDPEKQVLAPGFPSGSSSFERTGRSKPDQATTVGSVGSVEGLAGMVLTHEGEIMVPASQRADGSMRKEIKVRPGHFWRETLAEKYRPPAARVRTSTWDPRLRDLLATPPSTPTCNSPLPFTPKNVHQRIFGRQCNSPATLANNWRRLSTTVVETPLAEGNDPPPQVERLPAPEFSTLSQPTALVSPMSTRAIDDQSSLVQPDDQILPCPSEIERVEKVTVPAPDDSTERTVSSEPVRAAAAAWDKENATVSSNAEKENRLPLRDITTSLAVPEAVDRENLPCSPTVLAPTTARTFISLQATNVIQRDLEAPSRTPVTESRETVFPSPHRKRKPSVDLHTQCAAKSAMLSPGDSPTPTPHRLPRSRRSAPHLGKSASNRRQAMAQTPEGSAKRRRMRTASALGMENVALAVGASVDRNGQIVLPAGTGWKGRSLNSLVPSQLPVAQRQRQPTLASAAATLA